MLFFFFFNKNIKEFGFLFGYQENHRMVNFHLFSPDFLLLKTMFYSSSLFYFILFFNHEKGWVEFGYIVFGLNGVQWIFS